MAPTQQEDMTGFLFRILSGLLSLKPLSKALRLMWADLPLGGIRLSRHDSLCARRSIANEPKKKTEGGTNAHGGERERRVSPDLALGAQALSQENKTHTHERERERKESVPMTASYSSPPTRRSRPPARRLWEFFNGRKEIKRKRKATHTRSRAQVDVHTQWIPIVSFFLGRLPLSPRGSWVGSHLIYLCDPLPRRRFLFLFSFSGRDRPYTCFQS